MFFIVAIWVVDDTDSARDCFVAIYTLLLAALESGMLISQVPSISKAKKSAEKIFGIIGDEKDFSK